MRRRGLTVLVGAVLVIGLTLLMGHARVPYVQMEPGPTYDTLGKDDKGKDVVTVSGAPVSSSKGQLRFVTIGAREDLTLLEALRGWWRDDDAVIPRELLFPPDLTDQEVQQRNAEDFAQSGSAAEAAALTKLGYPAKVSVKEVAAGLPADGKLRPGDVIKTIDGTPVDSAAKLLALIRAKPAGATLTIGYDRGGAPGTVDLTTVAGDDGAPRIGIVPQVDQPHPFTLDIPVDNVGGPSAGLMLTLGILDKLEPEDLTGGKIIAGTGTIDEAGRVGPIGGVPQKIVAARRDGATVFLTPADNCAEAVANAVPGMILARVTSLDDALAALQAVRAGQQPALCSA
jgi:Lon-like protease